MLLSVKSDCIAIDLEVGQESLSEESLLVRSGLDGVGSHDVLSIGFETLISTSLRQSELDLISGYILFGDPHS